MLQQISYLGKFWFLRYSPKCSWPIRLRDFSINQSSLKLTVSHKEFNGINRFLVCLSNSFFKNVLLVVLIFGTMVDNLNIEKPTKPFLFRKIHICPNLGKKDPEWSKNRVFSIFGKILSCQFFLKII